MRHIRYILANCDYVFVNTEMLEDLCEKGRGEVEVACLYVERIQIN
jgi:molybdopterin-guanine dinucleotide biosynthesis protein A